MHFNYFIEFPETKLLFVWVFFFPYTKMSKLFSYLCLHGINTVIHAEFGQKL